MITLSSIEAKIEEYLNDKHDLTRSALDDLYKMYIVRDHLMESTLLATDSVRNGEWINEWASELKNKDGSTGAHWTKPQTNDVMLANGFNHDQDEFYIAMNMMYSDYSNVGSALGVDMASFCAKLADAFLCDSDAKKNKLYNYYFAVVE